MRPWGSRARSCCKNQYLVTLTFAPFTRNTWSRAQRHETQLVLSTFDKRPRHDRQAASVTAAVETGQMSSVETGQMSALEKRQMSSAETRQMSIGKTGRCPVLLFYICLVSAKDICLVSAAGICPVSTADICPVSTEDICPVSTADIWRSGPKSAKMDRNGSRMVARTSESSPEHAAAIFSPLGPVPRPKTRQKG